MLRKAAKNGGGSAPGSVVAPAANVPAENEAPQVAEPVAPLVPAEQPVAANVAGPAEEMAAANSTEPKGSVTSKSHPIRWMFLCWHRPCTALWHPCT